MDWHCPACASSNTIDSIRCACGYESIPRISQEEYDKELVYANGYKLNNLSVKYKILVFILSFVVIVSGDLIAFGTNFVKHSLLFGCTTAALISFSSTFDNSCDSILIYIKQSKGYLLMIIALYITIFLSILIFSYFVFGRISIISVRIDYFLSLYMTWLLFQLCNGH